MPNRMQQQQQQQQSASSTSAAPTVSSSGSNSLLDLLAGAPRRVTSPTSTRASTASQPSRQTPLSPSPSAPASSAHPVTAATHSVSSSPRAMSNPAQQNQPQDVSQLMHRFMAPTSPLATATSNTESSQPKSPLDSSFHHEQTQPLPVLHNKALQLPPSPPSSVSSATGKKLRQPSTGLNSPIATTPPSRDNQPLQPHPASATAQAAPATSPLTPAPSSLAVKTPFDFVSPFDMLSNHDEQAAPQTASAQAQLGSASSSSVTPYQQAAQPLNGYQAASEGIASLLHKLSASAATRKAAQKIDLSPETTAAAATAPSSSTMPKQLETQLSKQASTSSGSTHPARCKLPSAPAQIDALDKRFHASRHAAVLNQDDAFDDPKSSGLSVLSPSRSSSAPSIATLDLAAKQPGGLSSLRHTTVESSGVALLASPFRFPCTVAAAGLLPASRIANLGPNVACYAMSKGKIRLIHIETGARLLVQNPTKTAIRSIAAFQPNGDDANDAIFLLAALTERSSEAEDEGIVVWTVPTAFVLQGQEGAEPVLLGRINADPRKDPFEHRFTAITWHPTEPKLAISTCDSNVLIVDIAQHLLQTAPPTQSKQLRSLTEIDVEPRDKDDSSRFSEPLAGLAFSPDGSMLATISAVLERDASWILKLTPLGQPTSAVEREAVFTVESPLQKSMTISHLSFIAGGSGVDGDASPIRGMLIGFERNTVLGLYDLVSRSFKHVWNLQANPPADTNHFNLVQFDPQSSTLLVCNSFRSSILAVSLDLQPLPGLLDTASSSDYASLLVRLQRGLLPWSVQLSYPIKEFALQDPCTSISISVGGSKDREPSRLFVAFPEGISVLRLLSTEPLGSGKRSAAAAPQVETGVKSGVGKAEPVPEAVADSSDVDAQTKQSKSSKKKDKKKNVVAAATKAMTEVAPAKAGAPAVPTQQTGSQATQKSLLEAEVSTGPTNVTAPAPLPSNTVQHMTADTRAAASGDSINVALSDTIVAAVRDAVSANFGSSFEQTIGTAIPKKVERLISSTELNAELTRNIVQTILPAVQRTAMEVVSRVLAPHFEEVMMQVSERVERALVSEMTSVRKTLVVEQNESLKGVEKAIRSVQGRFEEVLGQLKSLNTLPASKTVEVDDDVSKPAVVKSRLVPHARSAAELSDLDAAPAPKRRDGSLEPAQATVVAVSDSGAVLRKDTAVPAAAGLSTKCQLPSRIAVIGAGPVGCLAALAFAQRGCKVDVFESRPDPRTHEAVARASQRSINLALSTRGITGLRSVSLVGLGKYASTSRDLADLVLQESVPMRARMIHVVIKRASEGNDAQVKEVSQLYSNTGESINSVDRGRLNNILLDHALMHPNVEVHFEHKLQSVDFDHDTRAADRQAALAAAKGSANKQAIRSGRGGVAERVRLECNVHSTNQHVPKSTSTHDASFVVGCDGAHSSIRSAMGSLIRMHYTHNYIDTGYVELSIPPRTALSSGSRMRSIDGPDGKPSGGHDAFHLDPNHLHIWPRHSFMLIALPNLDGSFTCTLFAPFKMFSEELSSKERIVAFFREHFPDAMPLIGEDKLVECLTTRRASALGSVQCDPYHYKDRAVLIGDAAHAMLPFYGQGLNCGFEDVRVLFDIIDSCDTLQEALERYTKERHPDLKAILQLAEQNYREMAHSVVSWPYLLRKKLDSWLMRVLPSSMWSSLYVMTTFSNLPYSQVVQTEKRQQRIISNVVLSTALSLLTATIVGVYKTSPVWRPVASKYIQALQNNA